jgi:general secretion pathway protein C
MRQLSLDRSNLAQTAVVALVTVAALALLGWVAEPRAQAVADSGGGASAGALFGKVQQDRNSAAPTGISVRLLGIVAATGGRTGYAVVQLEPRQILAVREGEDVAPGIRLAQVGIDHVVLDRSGIRETLAWPEKNASAEPSALRPNR